MSDQLIHISIHGPLRRALTVLPLVVALLAVWFAVRWFIGNTIAETVNPEERKLETAQMAVALAPDDPLAHWTLAEVEQSKFSLDPSYAGLTEYERAVKLSPHDYRFWLAWGRALEQAGDVKRAEAAMRRAVELAPAYAYPRWYLGNLLLRDGRDNDGFAELRTASDADPELRSQVFNLVSQVYPGDLARIATAIGPAAQTRAEFAQYLVARNQIESGLEIWGQLSAGDKQANRDVAASLIKTLVNGKHFAQALDVSNDVATNDAQRVKAGEIDNGAFEGNVHPETAGTFDWQIKSTPQSQVGFDPDVKHGGRQSLRLIFKARTNIDASLSQLVVVQPGSQYDFAGYVKTNKLESAATPVIEIVDAYDGSVLASSPPAPSGFNDWQQFSINFKAGLKTDGIYVRLGRTSCGDNASCPIFGTLWYDDFTIKRRG